MWRNNNPKHLPKAFGPHTPGCIDILLDYDKSAPLVRLHYPTDAEKNKDNNKKWIPWLMDHSYLVGITKVLMLHPYLMKLLFWWTGTFSIPVLYGEKIQIQKHKLKCIVMSHGLGGNRFLYSNICCELASNGFLVAALEHRDSSACNTFYYTSPEDAKADKRSVIPFKHIAFGENHFKERHEQLKIRSEECSQVLDFLLNLNNGVVPYNVLNDVPTERKISFKLQDLVGNLDVDQITMMGHSFGAATSLYTAAKRKEFKQCILLDPWMFSIKNENFEEKIKQPCIFINTQTFHIASNVKAMSKLIDNNQDREMYTILHTTHESQTDSVLLIGYWLNWFMKKLDPHTALRINNALILKFLNKCLNYPEDIQIYRDYLEEQTNNVEVGLTKPWA